MGGREGNMHQNTHPPAQPEQHEGLCQVRDSGAITVLTVFQRGFASQSCALAADHPAVHPGCPTRPSCGFGPLDAHSAEGKKLWARRELSLHYQAENERLMVIKESMLCPHPVLVKEG